MAEDIIRMSLGELKRLKAVTEAIDQHITQKVAASMIGISERQMRRLVQAVRELGDPGVIHKARGRPSGRKTPEKMRKRVLGLYEKKYLGFGPTLAQEKLGEIDGVEISKETLRQWLLGAGLWKRVKKGSPHRSWRQRKDCFGEMVQIDGSHHDWLEGRGPRRVLMGYRDDATNKPYARFYDHEGTMPALDSFKRYVKKYGLPMSVYVDRHTTYKSPKKRTEWEKDEGVMSLSQFERVLSELGVQVIHAYSPQAKGRVERLFGILQDRLVKEMRLRKINTLEEANEYLEEFLPSFNQRFGVCPANETDVHMKLPKHFIFDDAFCIKTPRTVRNDHTITYNRRLYQIEEDVKSKKVLVQERLNGTLCITEGERDLDYREITEKPQKAIAVKIDRRKHSRTQKRSQDHPWMRFGQQKKKPSDLLPIEGIPEYGWGQENRL